MARHNYVSLTGYIQKLTEDGFVIAAVRNKKANGDARFSHIDIDTSSCRPETNVEAGDVVYLTGSIATRSAEAVYECPHCGEKNTRQDGRPGKKNPGTETYVLARAVTVLEHGLSNEEAEAYLSGHFVSDGNVVAVLGNLTKDPILTQTGGQNPVSCCRFQLGVTRKLFRGERTADYPWVYTYGREAEDNYAKLKKGSLVLVSGTLQTHSFPEDFTCPKCGADYIASVNAAEISASSVEYISGLKPRSDAPQPQTA